MIVEAGEIDAALHAAARHGPFFDLIGPGPDEPIDWHPFEALVGSEVPPVLRDALTHLSGRLGSTEQRPVASLLQMSAAAQLCAPLLGTAVDSGLVPHLAPRHLEFGFSTSGGFRARMVQAPTGTRGDTETLARALGRQLEDGPVAVFTAAMTKVIGLSRHTTRGNLASTLAAAVDQLEPGQGEAGACADGQQLVELLLREGPLRGAGRLAPAETIQRGRHFRRRNCCLFYRLPGAGVCADCVLTGPPRDAGRFISR